MRSRVCYCAQRKAYQVIGVCRGGQSITSASTCTAREIRRIWDNLSPVVVMPMVFNKARNWQQWNRSSTSSRTQGWTSPKKSRNAPCASLLNWKSVLSSDVCFAPVPVQHSRPDGERFRVEAGMTLEAPLQRKADILLSQEKLTCARTSMDTCKCEMCAHTLRMTTALSAIHHHMCNDTSPHVQRCIVGNFCLARAVWRLHWTLFVFK